MEAPLSADPQQISLHPHVNYSEPKSVGEFSLNQQRQISLGRADARHICERLWDANGRPTVKIDLDANRAAFIHHTGNEYIISLLRWLQLTSAPGRSLKDAVQGADFVTWRGVLSRIAVSPYDKGPRSVGLKIACCRFKDVVFLCEYDTDAKHLSESTMNEYGKRASYWGYSFEHQITSSTPNGPPPDASKAVNASQEFVAMFRSSVGPANASIRLLFGAEIDCLDSQGNYLEIKTQLDEIGAGRYFSNKAVKWWMQSFLAGVRTIVVGLRDNDGNVRRIEKLPTENLPKMCKSAWNYAHCLAFLHTFLSRIKGMLEKYAEGVVVVAERQPNSYDFHFTPVMASDEARGVYEPLTEEFRRHFT